MAAHSRYGGSVIGRIIACPGSPALLDTLPKAPSSPYAEEGTIAHAVAEQCLKKSLHPSHFLGQEFPTTNVTDNMVEAVRIYLEAVTHEMALTKDAELYVEKGFALDIDSAEPGEVFGTNDAMVYHPSTGRLRVFDYKHGVGVSVSAEDNAQLKFYAAGAVFSNDWKVSELILTIVQPRARDVDEVGAVKDWCFEIADLFEFLGEVSEAVESAKLASAISNLSTSGMLQAGPHCDKSFCDARVACPAYQALKLAGTGFEAINIVDVPASLPHPSEMTTERLSAVVDAMERMTTWANACQQYLEGLVLGGVEVPGWKAVEKLGRRKWIADEETVADTLEMTFDIPLDLIRPRKLANLGDVEKLMKAHGAAKKQIDAFMDFATRKESSGLTIARDADARAAVNAAERAFGSLNIDSV